MRLAVCVRAFVGVTGGWQCAQGQTQALLYLPLPMRLDVLIGNKADLASPDQAEDFVAWGGELWPPKAQVSCKHSEALHSEAAQLHTCARP